MVLLTEAFERGNLHQHIAQINDFKERQRVARFFIYQLVLAVGHLHDK